MLTDQPDIPLQSLLDMLDKKTLDSRIETPFKALLAADQTPRIAPAARFPLITCSHVTYTERTTTPIPYYTELAAIAYRWGIPLEALPAFMVNLTNSQDVQWLNDGKWQALWNGVWIIYCGMAKPAFKITIANNAYEVDAKPYTYDAAAFLDAYGKSIVQSDRFRFGLVLGGEAAHSVETQSVKHSKHSKKPDSRNFVKELSRHVTTVLFHNVPFVGPTRSVQVITEGAHLGLTVVQGDDVATQAITPERAEALATGSVEDRHWRLYQYTRLRAVQAKAKAAETDLAAAQTELQRAHDAWRAAEAARQAAEARLSQAQDAYQTVQNELRDAKQPAPPVK